MQKFNAKKKIQDAKRWYDVDALKSVDIIERITISDSRESIGFEVEYPPEYDDFYGALKKSLVKNSSEVSRFFNHILAHHKDGSGPYEISIPPSNLRCHKSKIIWALMLYKLGIRYVAYQEYNEDEERELNCGSHVHIYIRDFKESYRRYDFYEYMRNALRLTIPFWAQRVYWENNNLYAVFRPDVIEWAPDSVHPVFRGPFYGNNYAVMVYNTKGEDKPITLEIRIAEAHLLETWVASLACVYNFYKNNERYFYKPYEDLRKWRFEPYRVATQEEFIYDGLRYAKLSKEALRIASKIVENVFCGRKLDENYNIIDLMRELHSDGVVKL
jgi:hypothetical protein